MEDGAVVKPVFALLVTDGMCPLALAFGEVDEVGYGFRGVLFKQAANDVALGSIENGVGTRLE